VVVERIPATESYPALLCASDEYITSLNYTFTPADEIWLGLSVWSQALDPPRHFFYDTPEVRRILRVQTAA
jgi:hypothetical protein